MEGTASVGESNRQQRVVITSMWLMYWMTSRKCYFRRLMLPLKKAGAEVRSQPDAGGKESPASVDDDSDLIESFRRPKRSPSHLLAKSYKLYTTRAYTQIRRDDVDEDV